MLNGEKNSWHMCEINGNHVVLGVGRRKKFFYKRNFQLVEERVDGMECCSF